MGSLVGVLQGQSCDLTSPGASPQGPAQRSGAPRDSPSSWTMPQACTDLQGAIHAQGSVRVPRLGLQGRGGSAGVQPLTQASPACTFDCKGFDQPAGSALALHPGGMTKVPGPTALWTLSDPESSQAGGFYCGISHHRNVGA